MLSVLSAAATAAPIKIKATEITHFIGTYDKASGTFTDYAVVPWNDHDPMGFHNAMSKFPDGQGKYFGLAPWYSGLAEAILDIPEKKVRYVAMVDVKLSYAASVLMTKWRVTPGDSLEFVCVTRDFPELGGAPNLDGYFVFPDSSYFLAVRSAGGDMKRIWRHYCYIMEGGDCGWRIIYEVESNLLPFEKEFTEAWCWVEQSSGPEYKLNVLKTHYTATGNNSDGSFAHQPVSNDSTQVNLWKMVQEMRTGK